MKRTIIICAALVAAGFGAWAQNAPDAGPKPAPQSVPRTAPVAYQLAAEDQISINVINFTNLSIPSLIIPPDGKITVPLLEPIDVVGKTTDELARLLAEKWKKYVINPSVTVALTSKRKENVLFYGFVTRVGTVEYKPTLHLIEALAEAGGAAINGDLRFTTVTHKSGEKQTLDLSKPETRGGTDADLQLAPGDVIYVPERRTQISVLGEVLRPGSLDYRDDMTVLDAITVVGGVKETADLSGATFTHEGKEQPLDLDAMLRHGSLAQNVKLAIGDRIMIPEFKNRTYTFGAVGKPGYYPFKSGDRVLDALNASGGPVRDANIAKINVIRLDKATNTAKVQVVDIEKVLKQGKTEGNVALQPGDVIYIPDKKKAFGADDVFRALGAFTGLGGFMRLFGMGGL